MTELNHFQEGDLVAKAGGYPWDGFVVGVFFNTAGKLRYVVELDRAEVETPDGDALHIFSPTQLVARP